MNILESLNNYTYYVDNKLSIWVTSLLLIYLSYKVTKFIYNVYLHPLHNIPGPKYLLFSSIFTSYYQLTGKLPEKFNQWHTQYGPVIRTGHNRISLIDQRASKLVYTNQKFIKSKLTELLAKIFGKNLFTLIDRNEHSKRRRIASQAFSQSNLDNMEPQIWQTGVLELLKKLDTKCEANELVNFIDEFHYLTVDIIGELAFGQQFNMIQNLEHELMDHIKNSTLMMVLHLSLPFLQYVRVPFLTKFYNAVEYKNEFARKAVELKKASNSGKKDIMHYLLEARDSETGEKLTDKQLQDEAIILLFAGVDSTASTMSLCIYNLLKYPKVYASLLEELDRVKPFDQETGEIKPYLWCRENLPYLEAVIYETLRLTPAFPLGVPRVVPEQGTTVGDYYLPESTEVSVSIYSYQRSSQYFSNPNEFQPERWLDKTDTSIKDSIYAFGKGSRVCIGKHLAWMEITLTLIGILTKFELKPLPAWDKVKGDDEIINLVHFKPSSGRISCRLSKRETNTL
ncbi:cytochrome P450 [Conidiobolus coronatus NRRL 28638]|uniref:Cytochrome P450 n=1 Tax=Conidiobolus coronatus (strain ATCC 28846 / CBS 209.66 / NRRL 28638) TaxID=796925 RepID=A0A137NTA8_CONC2|nr:cytochrome P450 [Conidiobolus coronatus NRRL 28638]|eukprot:KXN65959.1 cytochrome P450 [Conidiobolus coronatus NRRL 28638]